MDDTTQPAGRFGGRPKRAKRPAERRDRPPPQPLDAARIEEMALAYVARFATSAGKLDDYLKRKLRERGWAVAGGVVEDDADPHQARAEGAAHIAGLIARFVEVGYIDDEGFARMKTGSLLRRGYGGRRISQELGQAGIGEDIRADVTPGERAARGAALACARKRGLGPFTRQRAGAGGKAGDHVAARALREKQMAAMLRAGHGMEAARAILNAPDEAAAEAWVAEADE
jgi:regulatory protein